MLEPDNIIHRLEHVKADIAAAAERSNRDPAAVKLIAVSKTIDAARVYMAYEAGHFCFGENRVQELAIKADALPADVDWHMVGHLQRNKAKEAVRLSGLIHSVDSLELMKKVDSAAAAQHTCQPILLQANVSEEATKSGAGFDTLEDLLSAAIVLPNVTCLGFMTMAPYQAPGERLHAVFATLRRFRDGMEQKHRIAIPELSMGMSGDYAIAIEEGATMVRIGTAIFGERPLHP